MREKPIAIYHSVQALHYTATGRSRVEVVERALPSVVDRRQRSSLPTTYPPPHEKLPHTCRSTTRAPNRGSSGTSRHDLRVALPGGARCCRRTGGREFFDGDSSAHAELRRTTLDLQTPMPVSTFMRVSTLILLTVALGACERPAPPSKAVATSDSSSATTTASTLSNAPTPLSSVTAPFPSVSGAAVEPGTSCAGHGAQVTDAKDVSAFTRKGDIWSRAETWGCGCPTGPVFTVVYTPKTSPLEIRLCVDPHADHCDALCRKSLEWDLSAALKDAGATDVKFANL